MSSILISSESSKTHIPFSQAPLSAAALLGAFCLSNSIRTQTLLCSSRCLDSILSTAGGIYVSPNGSKNLDTDVKEGVRFSEGKLKATTLHDLAASI